MKPREFVKDYGIRSLVCCFSGGKDSLATTHYMLSELEDVDIDKYVVWADTGVMLPIVEPYVRDVCEQFGWKLEIVSPAEDKDFWTTAKKKGLPRVHRRWCCDPLKLKPIFEFTKKLSPQRGCTTGVRRDESIRRTKYLQVTYFKKTYWLYHPIFDWTEKQVRAYIKSEHLPFPPQYKLGLKETCMCGAFANKKEIMILKAQFPEFFQRFVELEKELKGYAAFNFGYPCYAKELAKQKTLRVPDSPCRTSQDRDVTT